LPTNRAFPYSRTCRSGACRLDAALVGSSGSGKSTLIGLVLRFNRPERQGAGRWTGLGTVRLPTIARSSAWCLQDNFCSMDDCETSRCAAHATRQEIEARRPHRALRRVIEQSTRSTTRSWVSAGGSFGGQRQRISIARAILADPASWCS